MYWDPRLRPPDIEAAHHLLTTPGLRRRAAPFVGDESVDWDGLLQLAMELPDPARVIVGTAYELCEARRAVALWEIPAALDPAGMERVIEALCICHGGIAAPPDGRRVAVDGMSAEHAAVSHVLASPRLADRVGPHVHRDGFDWSGLLAAAQTMSRSQRLLVDIAHDLWTRGDEVGVREVARSLDSGSFVRVAEALMACRRAFEPPARRVRRAARPRRAQVAATA
jgi:hypothetical protein